MSIKSKLQALRTGVSFFGLVYAFSSPAFAGAGTITVKDSTGATQTFDVVTDGSGHYVQESVTCDYSAAANCAAVDASHNLGVVVGEALPAGTNAIGAITSINNALPGGTATLGSISAIVASLPGGTATLGSINSIVSSLPGGTATLGAISAIVSSLPGGTATLGSIASIVSSLPGGTATIGAVTPGPITTWGLTPATTPSSAPTNALVGGVVYNTVQPTLTTGQSMAIQSDLHGNVIVANNGNFTVAVSNTNSNGQATMGASSPVVIASDQSTISEKGGIYNSTPPTLSTATQAQVALSTRGGVLYGSQYPAGALPVEAAVIGSSSAVTATLAGLTLATTYMCTMSVRSNAGAASTGTVIVAGPTTTLSYAHWTGVSSLAMGVTEMIYSPCVPGSVAGAAIVLTTPAPGTLGVVTGVMTGYQL